MKKILLSAFFAFVGLTTATADNTFKVCALNVDGLPSKVLVIDINPDSKGAAGATAIGQKLVTMGYDVVGLAEDFDFHSDLIAPLQNDFHIATYQGGITVDSHYNADISFSTDGLGLLARKGRAAFANEAMFGWNKRSGKFDNGADELILKGFRYYTVTFNDSVEVDLYIVHMDAECDEGSQAARRSNIQQVVSAVLASDNKRPVIIMGDTNCRYNRDKLKECCIDALNADPRFSAIDAWVEHERDSVYPAYVAEADASQSLLVSELGCQKGEVVDKVIYVNNSEAPYHISANYFLQDISFVNENNEPLADHWPVVVEFTYWKKTLLKPAAETAPATVRWKGENPMKGGDYYIFHPETGKFLSISGSSLVAVDAPVFLWKTDSVGEISTGVNQMTMVGGGKYFNLAKSGAFGSSAVPTLSDSRQTTEISLSRASKHRDYNPYKIHRVASPARYLNFNGSDFTGAQNTGEQNDWVFISLQQYKDSIASIVYQPVDLSGRKPNPMPNTFPGSPTGLDNTSRPATSKLLRQGEVLIIRDDRCYDLFGRLKK